MLACLAAVCGLAFFPGLLFGFWDLAHLDFAGAAGLGVLALAGLAGLVLVGRGLNRMGGFDGKLPPHIGDGPSSALAGMLCLASIWVAENFETWAGRWLGRSPREPGEIG